MMKVNVTINMSDKKIFSMTIICFNKKNRMNSPENKMKDFFNLLRNSWYLLTKTLRYKIL